MKKQEVIVVGAGLGGLSTALRLVKKGFKVTILEKNSQAGGRLNRIQKDGFTFDTGPSFFSMSYEFKKFAEECKIDMPFEFVELDPLYSVHFADDPRTYHLYKDIKKLAEQFTDVETDFEAKMEKYLNKSGALFHDTIDIVVKSNFDSLLDYVKALMQVNPKHLPVLLRNFWQQVSLHFSSKEARRILSLVAFFLGRTPFDTMAIYTLLSYTEFQHDGYYNVKGGMYKIVEGIVAELEKENVRIEYNTEIISVQETAGKVESVTDQNGKQWMGDIFVINSDAAVFRGKVLHRKAYSPAKLNKMNWTMGYLTIYLGISTKLPEVNHHNYYLGNNFEEYSNKVMSDPNSLEKPYYYVNVLSKHNPECAPEGCESLFVVCPVPTLLQKPNWDDRDKIVDGIIADFSKRIGRDIAPNIISRTVYTPQDWQSMMHLHQGSGLGLSHTMMQIGGFRPANIDEKNSNLFYVGASTIPGAGLPMAIISSELVCKRVYTYAGIE